MKIVAEAGINWNTLEEAKLMIEKAKEVNIDYVKFQLFNTDIIRNNTLYGVLRTRILNKEAATELFDYGKDIEQPVFFTPMFLEAVDWCIEMDVPIIKIRFDDRYNIHLIRKILDTDKRIIMSTDRQYESLGLVMSNKDRIDFLLCVPDYPASAEDYKLDASTFQFFSGISDHTSDLELAHKALQFGANILEKHVKLDDNGIEKNWSVTFEEITERLKI